MAGNDDVKRLEYRYTLKDSSWTLDFLELTVDEVIQLRRLTGYSWLELCAEHDRADALATKAMLWMARRKAGEVVEFTSKSMNYRICDLRREVIRDDFPADPADPSDSADPTPADSTSKMTLSGTSPTS